MPLKDATERVCPRSAKGGKPCNPAAIWGGLLSQEAPNAETDGVNSEDLATQYIQQMVSIMMTLLLKH